MRQYALPVAGVILNLALNLTIAKEWTKRLPDWVVVGLWILSLVPLGYWLWTNPKALTLLRTRYTASMVFIVLLGALCGGGLAGMAYGFWFHSRTKDAIAPTNPTAATSSQPLTPIASASSPAPLSEKEKQALMRSLILQYVAKYPEQKNNPKGAVDWVNARLKEQGKGFTVYYEAPKRKPQTGILMQNSSDNILDGSTVTGFDNGIVLENSPRNSLKNVIVTARKKPD